MSRRSKDGPWDEAGVFRMLRQLKTHPELVECLEEVLVGSVNRGGGEVGKRQAEEDRRRLGLVKEKLEKVKNAAGRGGKAHVYMQMVHTVVKALKGLYAKSDLNEKALQLQLYMVATRRMRRNWTAFRMTSDARPDSFPTPRQLCHRLMRSLIQQQTQCTVFASEHDSIRYLVLCTRKEQKGKKGHYTAPVFMALYPGRPHMCCSASNPDQQYQKALLDALGYSGLKRLRLQDPNLTSLFDLMHNKDRGTAIVASGLVQSLGMPMGESSSESDEDQDIVDVDATKERRRKELAKEVFGTERLPRLTTIAMRVNAPLQTARALNELPFQMTIMLRGADVLNGVVELVKRGDIESPLPDHIKRLPYSATNQISLSCQ